MRSTRWLIAVLMTVAVAIGYIARQSLANTQQAIQVDIHISPKEFGLLGALFFVAYAFMYVGGGRLLDVLGTRRGFLLIALAWSVACAGQGLAGGVLMLAVCRLLLGAAQGGLFPAAAKGVAEWFPARERGTAMGMMNGGSSVGAAFALPAVALVLRYLAWPWVFYLSGAVGLLWAAWWLWEYYPPAQHPRLSPAERAEIQEVLVSTPREKSDVAWWRLLALPQVWGMVGGKFLCDAIWFTYTFWLPKYLQDVHHFTTAQNGYVTWIPYAASGVGSVFGGWLSGWLLTRGYSLGFSRKAVLGASAAVMPCMLLVTHVPAAVDIVLFSLAFFAHLSFSTLVITLPADLFPRKIVATVVGFVGFGGSMGGFLFNMLVGYMVERFGHARGYPLVFAIGSTFHILGFLWILLTIRKVAPVAMPAEVPCEALPVGEPEITP